MASEKKKRKTKPKTHYGRGDRFLKENAKGIKGLSFYTSSYRHAIKREIEKDYQK